MVRRSPGRHRLSCREFPEARPACREAPETLWLTWVLTSGETEVRGMWVFSPGETPGAREVGVSWARLEVRGRRVLPAQRYLLCFGRLLYKLGLSANSQDALSMCMNVIVS